MIRVRAATIDDADMVRSITEAVYVREGGIDPVAAPEYARELLDMTLRFSDADILVALHPDPVGTVTAVTVGTPLAHIARPGELEIRMLAVLPVARRSGAATALVGQCEDLARRRGLERVVLCTETRMTAAQRLYAGLGYQRAPERDWRVGSTELLTYTLDLS